MRILFFGTPEIAAETLKYMHLNGFEIVGAVSQPDKPKGRSMKLEPTPVKAYAITAGIPVFQPESLKGDAILPLLKQLSPDLIVVIAYGKIFPKYILDFPPFGCVNIHASLLPKYRGAAPIQWAIINGDKLSGITTMYMAEGMDTGDMICSYPIEIGDEETSGELFQRMTELSGKAISDTIEKIASGKVSRTPQVEKDATYAPMLDKKIAKIDFLKPAHEVKNLIRGLNPWPVAYTELNGKRLKIYCALVKSETKLKPYEVMGSEEGIEFGCGDGQAIVATDVALEGSRRMSGKEFLAGRPIKQKIKIS